jgi:hypothetical protein
LLQGRVHFEDQFQAKHKARPRLRLGPLRDHVTQLACLSEVSRGAKAV